jgi:histidyl-tRNA synthetase
MSGSYSSVCQFFFKDPATEFHLDTYNFHPNMTPIFDYASSGEKKGETDHISPNSYSFLGMQMEFS